MHTPWGGSDHQEAILPGVIWVSTPSHGGLLILDSVAREHLTPQAIEIGEQFGSYLAYEEDCAYAVPCYEWAELRNKMFPKGNVTKADLGDDVRTWYPIYFEKRFGIKVGECPYCHARERMWCNCEYEMTQKGE